MNQAKLAVFKQETAKANIDILGISELKWTRKGEFNSFDHISTTVGRNPLEEFKMQHLDAISKLTEWLQFISKANHSISQ